MAVALIENGIRKGIFMIMGGSYGKILIIAVNAVIVLTCIIFAIPFNTVSYYTIEAYYDTEVKQEPYVATESYVSKELAEKTETLYDGTPYSVPHGIRVPFSITKPDTKLLGSFELPASGGFYIYASAGRIVYEQLGERGNIDISLPKGEYEALLRERVMWNERVNLRLILKWTEMEEVTKHKEVTKYREVPTLVEKQRTVTNYKKASFWEIIFGN